MSGQSDLERRLHQQEVVAELGKQALETDDLDHLMREACAAIADTLENRYCGVLERLPGGDQVLLREGVGWRDETVGSATVNLDEDSLVRHTMATEEPVIVDDLQSAEDFTPSELLVSHGVISSISVSIGSVEEPWGVLAAHAAERRNFTEFDAAFVLSVANLLASALDRHVREQELSRYHALTEVVNDVIVTIDENSVIHSINPAVENIFGYEPEELLGNSLTVLMPDELAVRHRDAIDRYLETGERTLDWNRVELPGQHADGSQIPLSLSFSTVEYGDQQFFTGVIRDVSERKKQERENERLLDLLQHTERIADVGGWEIDPETMEVFWSDHLFRLLGFEPGGQPALEDALRLYPEPDRVAVEEAIERALEEGEPIDLEATIRQADGELRWLDLLGEPRVEAGDVVALRGAVQDITDRKEREQKLKRANRRTEMALTATDATVWEWDIETDGVRTLPDPHGLFQTAVHSREDFIRAVHPADRDRVADAMDEAIESKSEYRIEFRYHRAGEVRWAEDHGELIDPLDEESVRMIGVVSDVTERKERERALQESHQRLEEFASAVSHDLREPLGTVASYLQLLERRYEGDLDEDAQEFIEFAVSGATRMREMIDGLVTTYARVESDGNPFESVDLDSVLGDVLVDLEGKIEASDAEISTEPLPDVAGDRGQLRQLLMNLVDNAIKYSGDAPPRVHIAGECDDDMCRISVSDEGIGIPAAATGKVFEVFERAHSVDKYPGTGIGLALCDRIVERHGGDIWVDSEPGEGATFSFTLPRAAASDT